MSPIAYSTYQPTGMILKYVTPPFKIRHQIQQEEQNLKQTFDELYKHTFYKVVRSEENRGKDKSHKHLKIEYIRIRYITDKYITFDYIDNETLAHVKTLGPDVNVKFHYKQIRRKLRYDKSNEFVRMYPNKNIGFCANELYRTDYLD